MSFGGFTHLTPLSRNRVGRARNLHRQHRSGERALQAKRAPRAVCRDIPRPQREQEPRSHHRDGDRAFHAVRFVGDLMRPQADDAVQCCEPQRYPPPPQIPAHHLARRHGLGQSGPPELWLWRPIVAPPLTAYPRAVSQMAPPPPLGIDPKGPAALAADGGEPNRRRPPAGQMSTQGFEGLPLRELPGAGRAMPYP
jgi:hypothetical protein